jgi:hypothetical protein
MNVKNNTEFVAWESRYFSKSLPENFSHEKLDTEFHRVSDNAEEHDIYFFSDNAEANIKLRLRSNTLKLKVLMTSNHDGFELWKTEFKQPLPASRKDWDIIDSYLSFGDEVIEKLYKLGECELIVEAIMKYCPHIKVIDVRKIRRFYQHGLAQLEVASGEFNNTPFCSVQFESENLSEAQSLAEKYPVKGMGDHCSYTTFLNNSRLSI